MKVPFMNFEFFQTVTLGMCVVFLLVCTVCLILLIIQHLPWAALVILVSTPVFYFMGRVTFRLLFAGDD